MGPAFGGEEVKSLLCECITTGLLILGYEVHLHGPKKLQTDTNNSCVPRLVVPQGKQIQNSSSREHSKPRFSTDKAQLRMTFYSKTIKTYKEKSTLNESKQLQQTEEVQIIKVRQRCQQ